ncbi:MAG: xanthine dehydrogenase family protein molybdopterin-binding subunit [Acetobacteraceae bacterium]|nr:xanthine dehydrogenase family protein molybdopterin-binding subunit [Acetobacteraceae bacterium]
MDKVRHVGEAIAVIVASSRYEAQDAAELVHVEFESLAAIVDAELALKPGAELINEQFQTNLIGQFAVGKGDAAAALADAPFKLHRRFYTHRYAGMPMECRGVIGAYDPRTDSVTIWSPTQVVHWVHREAAAILRLPESRVRSLVSSQRTRCRTRRTEAPAAGGNIRDGAHDGPGCERPRPGTGRSQTPQHSPP